MNRPLISLLHATYRRAGGPLEVRDVWLSRAVNPDFVEYVVSMDADDLATVNLTDGVVRLINPAWPGVVTAVRNWNAAAAAAKGDLLVVIADDLFPPQGWDKALLEIIGRLDPVETPFAVKVKDSPDPATVLMRHPVVSRAFYERFGLFSPAYQGVYCDDDVTARAFWQSAILDGRSLEFEHSHPNQRVSPSESQARINRREEYARGIAHYEAAWSWRQRYAERLLVPTTSPERLTNEGILASQRRLRVLANARFPFHVLRRAPGAVRRRIIWSIRSARLRSAPARRSR